MGNEYQPKCGKALQLQSKGRYMANSNYCQLNEWVAGKMCDPSLTPAIPERLRDD